MKAKLPLTEKVLLGILLLVIAAGLNYQHLTQRLDNAIYDLHLDLWSRQKTNDIILLSIDDRSLEILGRWPWPRRVHAQLLEHLNDSKAVGLDIIFSEPDVNDLEGDQALAKAIANHGRVVLPVSPVSHVSDDSGESELRELSSLPQFNQVAAAIGHVDVELDHDSLSRSIFLKAGLGETNRFALPLSMLQLEGRQMQLIGERNKTNSTSSNSWLRDYRLLLPLSDNPDLFQRISYVDAFDKNFDDAIFKDKWVLVGINAMGLGDRISTPVSHFDQPMSGVEFEAQVLDILLNNIGIQPLDDHRNMLLTTPFVILLLLLFNMFRTEYNWLATVVPLVAVLLFSLILARIGLFGSHYWFRPGPALLTLLLGYIFLHRQQLSAFIAFLVTEKDRTALAMGTVSDAVIITNKNGYVEFMNQNAEDLTGYLLSDAQSRPLTDVMNVQDINGVPYPIDLVTISQATNSIIELPEKYFLRKRDSSLVALQASAQPIVDKGIINSVIVAFSELKTDESDAKASKADPLTRLPNISQLNERLEHAIANAGRTKRLLSVLYIDLIDFTQVNNNYSEEEGDQLLKELAQRLSSRGRSGDSVARVNDDEFIVILENLEDIEPVPSVVTSLLDLIKEPYEVGDHKINVDACVGISVYPQDGMDVASLKNNAYSAMKKAKKSLRTDIPRFHFHSQKLNKLTKDRLLTEKDLRLALSKQQFELYYQPRVDFNSGKIVAIEALLRWRRPNEGLILPTSFIPLAERSGLISEIGTWVLQTACEQAKAWENADLFRPRIAVNLSPRQFLQHDLLDIIARILDSVDLEPRYLELEITENSLVYDANRCIEILQEFRSVGGTVSIDDFGTGYSSLSYLKNFPVDILKIDKVFTKDVNTEQDHAAISLAVISMAHSLNLKVVAEGVESEEQFNFLRSKGCDEMQGYFFSKPLSTDEMTQMLRKKHCLPMEDLNDNAASTLLLVDDDNKTLSRLGIMLRDEGYQILMADNADEALSLLTKHSVGVVVSNELIPGMKGGELLERIKNLYPNTIRMLFSADADRDAIISAINSGAIFKFLTNPISDLDFKRTLKEGFNHYIKQKKLI